MEAIPLSGEKSRGMANNLELPAALRIQHFPAISRWSELRPSALSVYIAAVSALSASIFAGLVMGGAELGNAWVVAVLALVAAAAERGGIWFSSTIEMSIALVPTLFAAVLFGPMAGMIVGAASMLGDLKSPTDSPLLRWLTYTSTRALTGATAGWVAVLAGPAVTNEFGSIAIATAAAAMASETLDTAFATLTLRLRRAAGVIESLRSLGPLALASTSLYAPIVAILAVAYREISPWTLALFLVPAVAAQRLYVLYHGQRTLARDVMRANDRLERANLSFATALVATLDARDRYTAGHSAAVAIYARDIAMRMGLSENDQKLAHLCGLVHDIGKIGLPPGLLEKRGPMTLDERRQMEKHSEIGQRILEKVEDYAEIAQVVRHHHERWDGNGYPDGLAGSDIPLISRIIAVADAYNAMTSDRPYRDAMPSRVARLRLAQAVESQFDTAVVAAFEATLASATEEYRSGIRNDFSLDLQELVAERGSHDILLLASRA